jgi:hypothetical protein
MVPGALKTIRFVPSSYSLDGMWPLVYPDSLARWDSGEEEAIFSRDSSRDWGELGTAFKAMYGAPAWTIAEVVHVRDAVEEIGIGAVGDLPTVESLKFVGSLGLPRKYQ